MSIPYTPINGEVLNNAPFFVGNVILAKNIFCPCDVSENPTLPLPVKTATIASFAGATLFNIRRYTFEINGVSYTKEINANISAATFASDKPNLENELVDGRLGLAGSLVGAGANMSISVSAGNLVIAITAQSNYVPKTLVVDGTIITFS
jgi:hypothetical protein